MGSHIGCSPAVQGVTDLSFSWPSDRLLHLCHPGRRDTQSKSAMKIHESTWTFMEFHGKKAWIFMLLHVESIISSKFMDRFVYEKCCVLTTWKFIYFHVDPSFATDGNEQFVWVGEPLRAGISCHGKPGYQLHQTNVKETVNLWSSIMLDIGNQIIFQHVSCKSKPRHLNSNPVQKASNPNLRGKEKNWACLHTGIFFYSLFTKFFHTWILYFTFSSMFRKKYTIDLHILKWGSLPPTIMLDVSIKFHSS